MVDGRGELPARNLHRELQQPHQRQGRKGHNNDNQETRSRECHGCHYRFPEDRRLDPSNSGSARIFCLSCALDELVRKGQLRGESAEQDAMFLKDVITRHAIFGMHAPD